MAKFGTFGENWITFLRPARELIFSLKYSYLNVLTGKNHPALGKIYTLRKMTPKWPKIDFSDTDFWVLSENRIFLTMNIENTYNKVYIARN